MNLRFAQPFSGLISALKGISLFVLLGWASGCSVPEVTDSPSFSESDANIILEKMAEQEIAWNRGDLDGFMAAYWPSDSLLFVGRKGPSLGWQTTLDNYRKSYSSREEMGTLTFGVEDLQGAGPDHALMLGSWRLDRTGDLDTLSGWFSLVWARKEGDWVIIRDHSS